MRISTAQLFRQATLQIQRHGAELARTQEVIASGRNILRPADDPNGAKHVLELDHSISMAAQFQANADQATNRLSLEETALGGATTALQRVRELVLQSANGTMTDPDREAIATERDHPRASPRRRVVARREEQLDLRVAVEVGGDALNGLRVLARTRRSREVGRGVRSVEGGAEVEQAPTPAHRRDRLRPSIEDRWRDVVTLAKVDVLCVVGSARVGGGVEQGDG